MGMQAMEAQGDIGSDSQRSQTLSLSRQGSLYNLTLNEVQNHLGEPLHSMNLDDLLKNIFTGESIQLSGMYLDSPFNQYASSSGLHRQGSIMMPRELSKKTVDEVWRDIQQERKNGDEVQKSDRERQSTLGEMTLEDFLVKAGVVADGLMKDGNELTGNVDAVGNINAMASTQDLRQGTSWLQQFQQLQGQQSMMSTYMTSRPLTQPVGHGAGAGTMFEAVFPEAQINISSPTLGAYSDPLTPGKKHGAPEDMSNKLAERRQKRMIKNRESAARSRARKQAYTNELENKVSRLEEENERLKKQKELDKIVFPVPLPEPRYQLRRTSSASF